MAVKRTKKELRNREGVRGNGSVLHPFELYHHSSRTRKRY